jgi:hypothetical protein
LHRRCSSSRCGHFRRNGFDFFRRARGYNHRGSFGGEPLSDGLPDPAAPAGHHDYLSF